MRATRADQASGFRIWIPYPSEDTSAELAASRADVALSENDLPLVVAFRPLVLAVPMTSDREGVSSAEAEALASGADPGLSAVDWEALPQGYRALRIDGHAPDDPRYPLRQAWSLQAASGFQAAAEALAVALQPLLEPSPTVRLVAVGDVMLDRRLGGAIQRGDLESPFASVANLLQEADITFANLEAPIGDLGLPAVKSYTFLAPPSAAMSLAWAGFDVVSLANNHALDYGPEALLQTIELLGAQGIAAVGAGLDKAAAHTPILLSSHGIRLAFLAYVDVPVESGGFDTRTWAAVGETPGLAWAEPGLIQRDVVEARELSDVVVVSLHSGFEGREQPSPTQVIAARAAIDAGASLVLGHHAHRLQGIEVYRHGLIAYGLGNFAFDMDALPSSMALNVWLDSDGVRQVEIVPVVIAPDGRPRMASAQEASVIWREVERITKQLAPP